MRIGPNGWPAMPMGVASARPEAGFRLPGRQPIATVGAVSAHAALLGVRAAMPSARDVVARRRGRALLGGLQALQRGLLGGAADATAMQALSGLLDGEDGEDPELADAMRAVALRARIELLRRAART